MSRPVVVTLGTEPTGCNPWDPAHASTTVAAVDALLFPGAFRPGPDGNFVLDTTVMVSAAVTSTDPMVVTYRIRDDATWSDGVPVSAEDFAWSWEQMRSPDADVTSTAGYADIDAVVGSADGKVVTVRFRSGVSFAEWPTLFSRPLLPAHVGRTAGWSEAFAWPPTVTAGAYRVEGHRPGQALELVRVERGATPNPGPGRITVRFEPDSTAAVAGLRSGDTDLAWAPPDAAADVSATDGAAADGVDVALSYGFDVEQLTFNVRSPVLAEVGVRRALAAAVDRPALVAAALGGLDPTPGPVGNRFWMPDHPAAERHDDRYLAADPLAAAAGLDAAGWTPGSDGVRSRGGERLVLRLLSPAGDPARSRLHDLLVAQLAVVGVEVRPSVVDPASFGQAMTSGDFDLALFAWVGAPAIVTTYAGVFASGQGGNVGGYANAEVDALFAEAAGELDDRRRQALGNALDALLWDELPNLPLHRQPTVVARSRRLTGVGSTASAEGPFADVSSWELAEG